MRLFYLGLLFFSLSFVQPAHADCTLAGTAVCDGVACPGKTYKAGQIIHNTDHGVLQTCLSDNTWKALHAAPIDPCTTSGTPGTACLDGQTVYAGSWNGSRYYTTTADQSTAAYWGTYLVTLGANAQSMTDGLTNTNTALPSIESNPQAGACNVVPFNPPACTPNAHVLCKDLRTTLGGDWYLPARDELVNVLYANRTAIGGFGNVWYWSSTEMLHDTVYFVRFATGDPDTDSKNGEHHVRCVKRG